MTTENWRGINVKGGNVDIHGNTFVFKESAVSIILDQQPPNVGTFQGREAELGQIQAWVQDPSVRLIGITASGGYGKTFLVAKALTQAEGVSLPLWISFNQPYTFANFGRWLLQQFGQTVDEKVPDEALLLAAVEQLSQPRGLLVMDNLETLLNEQGQWQEPIYGAFFQRWLSHGRQSTLLLTSREGFSLPDNQQGMSHWRDLEGLTTAAGIALLEAQGIRGAETDLKAFVDLVGGHPLSLNLTAGWLLNPKKNVAPDVTYALKQDDLYRFEDIVGDHRGDPDASVGSILAASVARLTPTLKTLWQNLSVYRLAFNLAAAQAMMATVTLDDLWELARRSLLQEQPVEGDVETLEARWQFKFLPLVQRFAQQQAVDLTLTHKRAIAYYCSVTKPKPWGNEEDVIPCVERFYHHCQLKQCSQAFSTLFMCDEFLELKGRYTLRIELYKQLLEASELDNANRKIHAACLISLGNSYLFLRRCDQAIKFYEQWLTMAREMGDRQGEADALMNLGNAYESSCQYGWEIEFYQQSLAVAHEIGDSQKEANVLSNLSNTYSSFEQYDQAIKLHQRLLKSAQKRHDLPEKARTLNNLGAAHCSLGNYQQAIKFFWQSVKIKRKIFNPQGEATSLSNLGLAYHSLGDYSQAIEFHQQHLDIAQAIGDRRGEAAAWFNLGLTQEKMGQPLEAMQYVQQARVLYDSMGLDAMVQRCDEEISRLSTLPINNRSTPRRGWFGRLVGWLLRVMHRLWGRMKKRG